MAQQHLYSRVPARMSIFNKTDGYDTFAASPEITRAYIEEELIKVYDNKPTKADALLIQTEKLPPIYCQYQASSGELIQSCMSFLAHDYTGERSSYLVHSLILSEKEREQQLKSTTHAMLNPAMFMTTVDADALNSLDSPFGWDYADADYQPTDVAVPATLIGKYSPEMLRKLIYACISVACGKTKGIFLTFKAPVERFSSVALDFLNTFLQIFPYHIRPVLSFTTYAGDLTKFNGFRIRCMTGNLRDVPSVKGMTLNFALNETAGISEDNLKSGDDLIDFFYGLMENDAVRREFMHFSKTVVEKMPALEKATLKNLGDLVLLFRQCSGLFTDVAVLPTDEKVYEFVSTYEKYRDALSDEFRADSFKFLSRYPKKRIAIPKNILGKLTNIYPGETLASKRVIMNVMLEFIHMDVMRDKLFLFMKNNYDDEDAITKDTIIEDLGRVYYGGFLQNQILSFFDSKFDEASEKSKDQIVTKLLLTLRTKEVQDQVVTFFDQHFDALSEARKDRFFSEFYKMLPEGDELSHKLIALVDSHMANESEELRQKVADEICRVAESDQRRKEPRLIPALTGRDGFCAHSILRRLFYEWYNRKAFTQYWETVWTRPFADRVDAVTGCFAAFPDMPKEAADKTAENVRALFAANPVRQPLLMLLPLYEKLTEQAPDGGKALLEEIADTVILPAICKAIPDALAVSGGEDGVAALEAFADRVPAVRKADEYRVIENYKAFTEALKGGRIRDAISLSDSFKGSGTKSKVADNLREKLLKSGTLGDESLDMERFFAILLIPYYKSGKWKLSDAYRENRTVIEHRLEKSGDGTTLTPDALVYAADEKAIGAVIGFGILFSADVGYAAAVTDIFGEGSDLPALFTDFSEGYGKKGKRFLEEKVRSVPAGSYRKMLDAALNGGKAPSGGFFSKLFGKK